MPIDTRSLQLLLKELYAPTDIVVDKSTVERLEELCSAITDTCGLIEATLELAIEDQSEKRLAYMRTALNLSARGTKSIKLFLSEWSVLVGDSKSRENSGRSARDAAILANLTVILNSLVARGLTTEEFREAG